MYETDFFAAIRDGSSRSAQVVLPPILDAVKPKAVVDFGCGTGEWLKVCKQEGVDDVVGYDGSIEDPDVPIVRRDLTQPLTTKQTFDLAVCLEVAEHLPESAADTLVTNLVKAAPVVLFSAAIPGQTGYQHINEQWPDYWYEKFRQHGYDCVDLRTAELWEDERVEWWYRQNLLMFFTGPRPMRGTGVGVPAKFVHPYCPRARTRLRVTLDVDLATNQTVVVESRLI